jgi:DNA-directed RNA polymerase subunit RPC12/RpoP
MRCPKCHSRSLIADHDDTPGTRERSLLCVCCGKRLLIVVGRRVREEQPQPVRR